MSITALPNTSLARRETYAALDSAGRLYVHGDVGTLGDPSQFGGGEDPIFDAHSEPERYDSSTQTWTVLDNPPEKLYQQAFILDDADRYLGVGSEILCFAANLTTVTSGHGGAPPDTWVYDPSTGAWSGAATSIGFPAGSVACTSSGLAGGGGGLCFKYNGFLYCQDAAGVNIQRYTGGMSGSWVVEAAQAGHIFTVNDHSINPYRVGEPLTVDGRVIFTSATSSTSFFIRFYTPSTASWSTSSAAPVSVTNGSWDGARYVYYWAIVSGTEDLIQYDTVADTWTTITGPFPGASSTIQNGVLIAAPTAVYMLGYKQTPGPPPFGFVGDIYACDLASGTWSNLSPDAIPIDLGNFAFPTLPKPNSIVKDTLGGGFYLVGWGGSLWDNHVYYFNPGGPPPLLRRPRSYVQVIG